MKAKSSDFISTSTKRKVPSIHLRTQDDETLTREESLCACILHRIMQDRRGYAVAIKKL
jgi:hypothetical protein